MSRLIDTNTFRRFAHEQLENDKLYSADDILEFIDEQPTAYDPEEVVKQLEELLETLSDGGDDWYTAEKINDAIEIVRRGGVKW